MRTKLGLLLAMLALTAGAAQGGVIHVPGDYSTIHAGVQACPPGDTVLVAAGTYTDCTHPTEGPAAALACVIMKSGVTLRGAGKDATIIDAQNLGRGIYVEAVSNVRIENLQVRGAYAALFGSGILFYGNALSNVEASDLTVTLNGDGGIILYLGATAVLRRIDFLDNTGKRGAGLSVENGASVSCYDSYFAGNYCPFGGAILIMSEESTALIDGCVFDGNHSTGANLFGGGIQVSGSSATITNCEILNNTANGSGGGVAFAGGASGGMSNCLIMGNQATHTYGTGGGIYVDGSAPLFESLVIAHNQATGFWGEGGGVSVNYSPAPTFRNCTIFSNSLGSNPDVFGGNVTCQFSGDALFDKCIIAESPQGQGIYCFFADPTFTCCDVWGNEGGDALCGIDGGGNFSLDPLFCAPGDYHLQPGSPCLTGCGGELVGAPLGHCGATAAGDAPQRSRLLGNHPNPFNPSTTIVFALDAPGAALVRITDVSGRTVATLTLGDLPAGRHEAVWDGRDEAGRPAPSGVYMYELQALGLQHTRRMILIK